jgi:hypothetical protein
MAEAPTNSATATNAQSGTQAGTPATRSIATTSPAFRISKMEFGTRYLKLLIYGPYGVGKTTLGASSVHVQQMLDVLYVSVEGGELSLEEYPPALTDNNITVRNFRQMARVVEFLRQHCRLRDAAKSDELIKLESTLRGEVVDKPHMYRTVVLDTLSEVVVYMAQQIQGFDPNTMPLDQEVVQADARADWGKLLTMERNFVRAIRDLPMNVICICPEFQVEIGNKDNKRTIIRPAFQGRFVQEVAGFFDVVGYMRAAPNPQDPSKVLRQLDLMSGTGYDAKNRIQAIKQAFIRNPTMADLVGPLYKAQGGTESQ